jgi:CotH protein.
MRYIITFALLVALLSWEAVAQIPASSNLPIVIINTDGNAPIVDNPRVLATMKIIYRGPGARNYFTDQNTPAYLNYNGRIDIEIRGSSSQVTDKKQYGFTTRMADNITNNNVSLLGMPSENDWILNGMVFDTARMRDYLCYNLARQIGEYASRTAYCELIINGDYRGLYLLQEKIKADKERVNIIKITKTDIYQPEITGGYITKADKNTGSDPVAWWMTQWNGGSVAYIHDLPKPEDVTPEQNNYIYNQFNNLANAALNHNMSLTTGIPSIIDIPSFIDHILISEISSNADAYEFSTYFHKDRNGKLRAGPIWDNDLTYGNDLFFWGLDRSKTNIWQFSNGDNDGSRFWHDMFNTATFKCYLSKRWNELILSEQPLNLISIDNLIDLTSANISEAIGREYSRWSISENFSSQLSSIKTWLAARISWITTNVGSYSACSNVYIPSLVITKINYDPEVSNEFPASNDLEFIEITNIGTVTVDLTGIYFSGTGLVYQFPPNSTLPADSSLFLAGNTTLFQVKYGFTPFGKFTRDLSNNNQNIVLADGFGNVIDNVHYYDSLPWPDADGNGYYLQLTDPALDNNEAESWIASNDIDIIQDTLPVNEFVRIYPNPVDDFLNITADQPIGRFEVFDMQGRLLVSENISSETYELNVSHFPKGAYIVRIISAGKSYTKGLIKR